MNFSIIKDLILLISVNELKTSLLKRVKDAFMFSFKETNSNFGWKSSPNADVIKYLEIREDILSKKTLDRLTGNLEYTIMECVKNRESITEVKAKLNEIFIGMKDFEIERLARTEMLNAFQSGEFQSQIQSGVATYKIWKANVNNKRTAADSLRLHNQIQKISDPFIDPKDGKESIHSPNRPNCRCTIQYLYELPKNIKRKNGLMYLE
jgi:hypothetical protein